MLLPHLVSEWFDGAWQHLVSTDHHPTSFSGGLAHEDMSDHQVNDDDIKSLTGGAVKVDLLNNNNSQYYGDFTLGNPKQRFTAVFDTGSGITWIPGKQCESETCKDHHRFDTGNSDSFQEKVTHEGHTLRHRGGQVCRRARFVGLL